MKLTILKVDSKSNDENLGLFTWSELAQLVGLAHPGEMIFIPHFATSWNFICMVGELKKYV